MTGEPGGSQTGEWSQGYLHGSARPPRHAANSRPRLSVGGKRKRKSFSRSRTRANTARPRLPRAMLVHLPPSGPPKRGPAVPVHAHPAPYVSQGSQ